MTPKMIAEAYYSAVGQKQIEKIEKYLHPDVRLIGPLAKLSGKEAVIDATKSFSNFFNTLEIRSTFGEENQAVVIYELNCPEPVGTISASVLMTFQEGLIEKLELFYDARPFAPKKEEIFSS